MRSKKALYNMITQLINDLVIFICNLILPRLILSNFGSEYNGLISSITQFLEYISLLTLGVSGSTRVAIYKAKGDIKKVSGILKATEKFMRKIAVFFIIYMIILCFAYPQFVNSNISNIKISILVLIIAINVFAEYFFGITYVTFVSAMQSRYLYNIILIVLKILSTVASVLLIYFGQGIEIVKLISTLILALGPILLNIIVKKKFKIISDVEPDESALSQRKDVMAHSVANCVHQYTDVFLLSFFSDPKTVSVYSVYTLVLGGIKKIESIFTNGLEGAFGEMWAKGENEKFKENFNIFEFFMFCFVSVVFTCTAYLLMPFVSLYTRNVTDTNYIIPLFSYLSVLSYAAYSIRTPYLVCVQAAGKYKETKNGAIIEAILNFVISLILIFPLGLVGITIGTLFANLFRTIQYEIYASKNLLKRSNLIFFKRILWLVSCFCITTILKKLLPNIDINSWKTWILNGLYFFTLSSITTIGMSIIFYRSMIFSILKLGMRILKKGGNK